MIYIHVMARMDSTRAPGKACTDLAGKPCFIHAIERVEAEFPNAPVILNTTTQTIDDPIAIIGRNAGYEVFRGAEEHPTSGIPRADRCFKEYELEPDDIIIWTDGDSPFEYAKLAPFIAENLKDCHRFVWAENPASTLVWGVNWPKVISYEGFNVSYEYMKQREFISWWTPLNRHEKCLMAEIPTKLKQPWPWRRLLLDYPQQVAQAKEIFGRLYKGNPLDVFNIYELMCSEPVLAHLTVSIPEFTLYDQHKNWYWQAYRDKPHETITIPDDIVL